MHIKASCISRSGYLHAALIFALSDEKEDRCLYFVETMHGRSCVSLFRFQSDFLLIIFEHSHLHLHLSQCSATGVPRHTSVPRGDPRCAAE